MAPLSAYELIQDFGERNGDRCSSCGKFTVFEIKFDDPRSTVVKLCSMCDVEKTLASE